MAESAAKRSRRDGVAHTIIVALLVSLVCSALVSAVAVKLQPLQQRNEAQNRQRNILQVVGRLREDLSIEEQFEFIETRLVDLASGEYVEDVDAATFDPVAAALDRATGVEIPAERDLANLKRRARYAQVYLVMEGQRVSSIILPVSGAGLWSRMYGFLALESDGNTVKGLKFYEHGETPGLGDQVDKDKWLSLWEGKLVFDGAGEVQIEVIRGRPAMQQVISRAPRAGDPVFQVDGMAGATLTGRGVTNLLRYWLGADGFGPYLKRHWGAAGERQGESA